MRYFSILLLLILNTSYIYSQNVKNNKSSVHTNSAIQGKDSLIVLNQLRKDIIIYTQALANNNDKADLYSKRGMIYVAIKDYANAINDFTSVINFKSGNIAEAYFFRGISKAAYNDNTSACEDFKQAKDMGYDTDWEGIKIYCNNLE